MAYLDKKKIQSQTEKAETEIKKRKRRVEISFLHRTSKEIIKILDCIQ